MFKIKLIILVVVILLSFTFTQELTKKQKREYRSKRIIIDVIQLNSTYNTTGYSSIGMSQNTWYPKIHNKIISESKFYNLVDENNYYKEAKIKENLLGGLLISGSTISLIGLVISFIGISSPQVVLVGLTTFGVGLLPLIGGMYISLSPKIIHLETAKELADEYNKGLKIKISKKF